jgi:glycosyltransferase involved in cell wall biosynthesis
MPARIRVLQILEATTGGTRRHLVDLARHLDPTRFELHLAVSTRRDPDFLDDLRLLRERGLEATVVPMLRAIRPWHDLPAFLRLRRLIAALRPDIVHTHSSKAGFLGRLAARQVGTPAVVHTPHVFPFQMAVSPALQALYRVLERRAARWADRIACVCEQERREALRLRIAAPDRLVVIPNGVEAPIEPPTPADRLTQRRALGLAPDGLVVGMVARFTRQKGHADLLAALPAVFRREPGARVVLVGDGELRAALERDIAARGFRGQVTIVGAREDAARCYPAFDVTALPSLWEGMPYALLDAMAHGSAIVATTVGGVPEAIKDGQSGLLVPPSAPDRLADALTALLADPALRARLGEAARRTVQKQFRLPEMIRMTAELYAHATRTPE